MTLDLEKLRTQFDEILASWSAEELQLWIDLDSLREELQSFEDKKFPRINSFTGKMEYQIVSLEIAKKLKGLGFSLETYHFYNESDNPMNFWKNRLGWCSSKKNYNSKEEYFYSAPSIQDAIEFVNQKIKNIKP